MQIILAVLLPLVALLCSSLARAASPSGRHVFAHVVQGNFQNYVQQDYADDFALAQSAGIDAFAINVGCDTTDPDQLVSHTLIEASSRRRKGPVKPLVLIVCLARRAQAKMFAAAESASFKLFLSFDMNYFRTATCASKIVGTYMPYVRSTAYFKSNCQAFVSTFAGDVSGTWVGGTSSLAASNAYWTALWAQVASAYGRSVFFVPNFNVVSNISPKVDPFSGVFSWDAWGDAGRKVALTLKGAQSDVYASKAAAARLKFMGQLMRNGFVEAD